MGNEHDESKFDICDICNKPIDVDSEDYQIGAANHYGCWYKWCMEDRNRSYRARFRKDVLCQN